MLWQISMMTLVTGTSTHYHKVLVRIKIGNLKEIERLDKHDKQIMNTRPHIFYFYKEEEERPAKR